MRVSGRGLTSPAAMRLMTDSCKRRMGRGPGGGGEGARAEVDATMRERAKEVVDRDRRVRGVGNQNERRARGRRDLRSQTRHGVSARKRWGERADDCGSRWTGSFSMRCLSECALNGARGTMEGGGKVVASRAARRDATRRQFRPRAPPHVLRKPTISPRCQRVCIFPLDHFSHDLHLRCNTPSDTGRHDDDAP